MKYTSKYVPVVIDRFVQICMLLAIAVVMPPYHVYADENMNDNKFTQDTSFVSPQVLSAALDELLMLLDVVCNPPVTISNTFERKDYVTSCIKYWIEDVVKLGDFYKKSIQSDFLLPYASFPNRLFETEGSILGNGKARELIAKWNGKIHSEIQIEIVKEYNDSETFLEVNKATERYVYTKAAILMSDRLKTIMAKLVQECPCPTTVRSPENEDSEVETGLKSQEDSDSVEAKSE